MRITAALVCLSIGFELGGFANTQAQDEAKKIIERGLAAAGGKDKLVRFVKCRGKSKWTVYKGEAKATYTFESWCDGPLRCKQVLHIDTGEESFEQIRVLNGDKAWQREDGETTRLTEKVVKGFQQALHDGYLKLLFPLLEEPRFKLQTLGKSKVGKYDAVGVKVSAPGKEDVSLYFDVKTWLIVKKSVLETDPRVKNNSLKSITKTTKKSLAFNVLARLRHFAAGRDTSMVNWLPPSR